MIPPGEKSIGAVVMLSVTVGNIAQSLKTII